MTDPSPTNAFEDAEIAREEANDERVVAWAEYRQLYQPNPSHFAREAIAFREGFNAAVVFAARQSPASTTAADAWDEGQEAFALDFTRTMGENGMRPRTPNPYRVAAPEGDGGNE